MSINALRVLAKNILPVGLRPSELREINNTLKENLDFENNNLIDNKTPIERFNERVDQMSQNWSEDEVNNLFLYKEEIDPIVLTYLSLDGEERRAITH